MGVPGSANPLLLVSAAAAPPAGSTISRSLRFNSADSAYLSRTPSSAGNRKTWTWSGWVKRTKPGATQSFFSCHGGATNTQKLNVLFVSNDRLLADGATGNFFYSTRLFRDPSAWMHIVIAFDSTDATAADRLKIYQNGVRITDYTNTLTISQNTDYAINQGSVTHYMGRQGASAIEYFDGYLADVHFIDGQALDPTSFGEFDEYNNWQPKAYTGSYGTNGFHLDFSDATSTTTIAEDSSSNNNDWTANNISANQIVYSNNVTSSTGSFYSTYTADKLFDGGTTYGPLPQPNVSTNYWTCTFSPALTGTVELYILQNSPTTPIEINGTTYTPSSTGWYTSPVSTVSSIKAYGDGSGTYRRINAVRVNGTILVDGVPANQDSLFDSPTNSGTDTGAGGEVSGNYATLNPLNSTGTLSNGNLDVNTAVGNFGYGLASGFGMVSGKWYFEATVNSVSGTNAPLIGIASSGFFGATVHPGATAYGWVYRGNAGDIQHNSISSSYGDSFTAGDTVSCSFDADAGSLVFYKNGVSQGVAYTGLSNGPYFFAVSDHASSGSATFSVNFGQRPFAYSAPSGFKALCTANLDEPTVPDGSTAMDAITYDGNNTTQTITGLNFSPDLVWIKRRPAAENHVLTDTVRGASKALSSDSTAAEKTTNDFGLLTAFTSDGFTVTAGSSNPNWVNASGSSYATWAWDAGSSTVSNTDGSITSSVRANPTAGFSIVSYTGNGTQGATIGHGLNAIPEFVIIKNRADTDAWDIFHKDVGYSKVLRFSNAAAASAGDVYPSSHTSSVIKVGNSVSQNGNNEAMIAYCFAPVEGYSAFGSYTGNGSTDGPFVFTGMRPRWILIKKSSGTENWRLHDTARSSYNVMQSLLFPNLSNAEVTNAEYNLDVLSNGFKIRTNVAGSMNDNGSTYIYCAFAEHPFRTSRAR